MSVPAVTPSTVAPRGKDPASGVYLKLAFFTTAIFAAPLSAFFATKDSIFAGNATYAGGLAALVVNIVLVAYVVTAFLEDDGTTAAQRKPPSASTSTSTVESKKSQ
ncbi:unnamed protein product [Tilletia controversa]|uniref:Vacuolar ATPase assembly integral membrane protein VMA21 n=3 Tax=Tilletia TaxID=13289 RepID=A0A8X7SZ10_9BASI|nr:hypothetical protein CF336_g182 [Tilletia laevis]KAE8203732.1 hypothetical protein CF328_g1477 [Tilletia controversa]KAE8265587.1 hypothetical protein A4X03_0g166 [Tilletia caries]KAE8208902.1 hypothetical protein CF335_g78 [Tilletia laevis]KAE8253001.1 hypothetical protein A4X06_0g1783 [Tilletia controversa]